MLELNLGRVARLGSAAACGVLAVSLLVSMPGTALADGGDDPWLRAAFAPPSEKAMRLGARTEETGRGRKNSRRAGTSAKGVQVASLGNFAPAPTPPPSLTGGGVVRWVASASCLTDSLRSVIAGVASFGTVTVSSTCRSHSHNRRVGGARRSHHLTGSAADFRVRGNVRAVHAYLRSHGVVGGLKHYGGGLFHIDTGPRRSW
jgi:Peptidase M15